MKQLITLAIVGIMSLSIAACGSSASNTSSPNSSSSSSSSSGSDSSSSSNTSDSSSNSSDSSSNKLKDGTYTAEADDFASSGWKDNVTVTISDGKVSEVNWNATNVNGGEDKKTFAASGEYKLKEKSPIGKEWDEQAAAAEAKLVEVQDPSKLPMTSEGYADGISGCTINIQGFADLADEAISQAK